MYNLCQTKIEATSFGELLDIVPNIKQQTPASFKSMMGIHTVPYCHGTFGSAPDDVRVSG